ncbi:MAG: tyrosine-protein phosphatase [Treponema sp.]|jgi:protein-tyrosine phosphatase|nr:tyrosine-protein phosphatase [Treponema sp.]
MEGILNVRDLGGYPVRPDGKRRRIKRGLLYRSEGPSGMSAGDQRTLEDRKIKTVADFRAPEEKSAAFELAGARRVDLPINAGNLMGFSGEDPDPDNSASEMLRLYAALPVEAVKPYRELFALLADPARSPLLFHCSAGKDRTGLAAALILYALGADRETILADYLLSSELLRRYWEPHLKDRPYMIPYLTVREAYLDAALKVIEGRGGLDRYLAVELGADRARLWGLYTE